MSLLLGVDLGTSFIKVSVVDAVSGACLCTVSYPDQEMPILSKKPGWAEQCPNSWWKNVCEAIKKANHTGLYDPKMIEAIGIAYQMHGLVVLDKDHTVLRDAIIWCDSRATDTKKYPFGNFTAGKLAWVQEHEPDIYERIDKILLPGDFIAMKLTGEITTTPPALSEGIFWSLDKNKLRSDVFSYFGFEKSLIPFVRAVFSEHGRLKPDTAMTLRLTAHIPVSYKAGDQLNNALSLNVFEPGDVAATAGTSGVIYAVTDQAVVDPFDRVNAFAHVNHAAGTKRLGVLLCINGCGVAYSWMRKMLGGEISYDEMNTFATTAPAGSGGLQFFPFGNGAERMLRNKTVSAGLKNLDLNRHSSAHMIRAVQEGIAFSFRYGLDCMRENGIRPTVIRAGLANLFLSPLFAQLFADITHAPVELYETSGAAGAAIGAGIGANLLSINEAFENLKPIRRIQPSNHIHYNEYYQSWKQSLVSLL